MYILQMYNLALWRVMVSSEFSQSWSKNFIIIF